MATTNAQEKQELFKTIWKIADELRGKVDGWDFKAYVLGTLFYRYLSENIADRINKQEQEAGDEGFDYASLTDDDVKGVDGFREELIKEIGFFLYPSQLFCNVTKNASKDENLNMTLEQVFRSVEESAKGSDSEKCFSGLFSDFDVNSNKLGATVPKRNETLIKLLTSVRDMDFGSYTDNTVDLLGDAYEFLMGMYASNAGKSGGEYFTPQEVSTLLTKIAILGKDRVNKVYDPACGSGSLLLKSAKILGKDKVDQGYFGQELNVTTYNLCRINMFLHNIGYDKFDIANEDTLTQPMHWDEEPFDVIVSNPPYSTNWVGEDDVTLINDPRFSPAGILAPRKNSDMAFIMHSLSWLAPSGVAAIVCFPGIMYRAGAEQKIRKYLVDNNYIDAIIQLPKNLFFGTGISTCIMVLKKNKTDNKLLFIDASKEFIKDGNSNRLTEENIENILKIYAERCDIQYLATAASYDTIVSEKYNLSVSTYVEEQDDREPIEIGELNTQIQRIVDASNRMRTEIDVLTNELSSLVKKSKLESLIDTLCPKGVPMKLVGDVFDTCTDYTAAGSFADIAKNVNYINSPDYALLVRTMDVKSEFSKGNLVYIDEHAFEYLWRVNLNEPSIIMPNIGNCGEVYYVTPEDLPYERCALAPNAILLRSSTSNLKYLSYVLQTYDFQKQLKKITSPAGQTKFNKTDMKKLYIPVPPIEIQEEIVRILDTFTNLEAMLQKELVIRQSQREYYLDTVFAYKKGDED